MAVKHYKIIDFKFIKNRQIVNEYIGRSSIIGINWSH